MERAVKKYIFWGAGTHGRLAVEKFGQNHTTDESLTGFLEGYVWEYLPDRYRSCIEGWSFH